VIPLLFVLNLLVLLHTTRVWSKTSACVLRAGLTVRNLPSPDALLSARRCCPDFWAIMPALRSQVTMKRGDGAATTVRPQVLRLTSRP
jgi:hypothetical protein